MLESLYVKDFAIVEEAEIVFGRGMTVVTGETGAGKSLMVDALLLLAGQRADAGALFLWCWAAWARIGPVLLKLFLFLLQ